MRWDSSAFGGFILCGANCEGAANGTWLPVGDDVEAINVNAQRHTPRSMFDFVRNLLWARNRRPSLQSSAIILVGWEGEQYPEDVIIFVRPPIAHAAGNVEECTMVAVNYGLESVTIDALQEAPFDAMDEVEAEASVILSSNGGRGNGPGGRVVEDLRELSLGPFEGKILDLGGCTPVQPP